MALKLGIVGLPNVGKSTLFNALTKNAVPAENYPFCTIEPNVGRVFLKDKRLDKLAEIESSAKKVYADVDFVDIAGLVKGAAEGEGLGNKFLSEIQNVDAIVHVVRIFDNADILHVNSKVDPKEDIETINTELILKDIEILSKHLQNIEKALKFNPKLQSSFEFLTELNSELQNGKLGKSYWDSRLKDLGMDENLAKTLKEINLITTKQVIFLANVDETFFTEYSNEKLKKLSESLGVSDTENILPLSVKLESELSELDETDLKEFCENYGLDDTGINKLTKLSYEILGLMSFFTTGADETRAWTIKRGSNARIAAGKIHTDFYDKFIAAEVVAYDDFVKCSGYKGVKEAGKMRLESKDYIVKDGDIMNFKHGA